ncbi:hypothetical protein LWI28_004487 [Acer negundo]|uniref:Uncharacterized protein n=1 Tax=Acer negundo TaxID=4023 RepID=A0AAD5NPJ1_ACENE|nr:hypothetical protein LWI28_004487 [Acer negundo]
MRVARVYGFSELHGALGEACLLLVASLQPFSCKLVLLVRVCIVGSRCCRLWLLLRSLCCCSSGGGWLVVVAWWIGLVRVNRTPGYELLLLLGSKKTKGITAAHHQGRGEDSDDEEDPEVVPVATEARSRSTDAELIKGLQLAHDGFRASWRAGPSSRIDDQTPPMDTTH